MGNSISACPQSGARLSDRSARVQQLKASTPSRAPPAAVSACACHHGHCQLLKQKILRSVIWQRDPCRVLTTQDRLLGSKRAECPGKEASFVLRHIWSYQAPATAQTLEDVPVNNSRKSKLCRQCQANPAERMFNAEEVRAIVAKAVKKNEEELRFEYDRVLQSRLAEQFENFTKYYEDYVSRMSKQSDFSYMS